MSPSEIASWLANQSARLMAQPLTTVDLLAFAAGAVGVALIAASALVKTMVPLRWLAVGSNLGFLAFGALHQSYQTLVVAAVLLPINLYRLREISRLTRKVAAAGVASRQSGLWLRPYMRKRQLKAGTILFRKGDLADRLYLLVEGELQLVEFGRNVEPGRVFGEIALFSPTKRRTATARCLTDCTVLTIDEETVHQLYYQDPAFGFSLIELIVARLSNDISRADSQKPRADATGATDPH
jgi:hypothetical protein